MRPLIGHVGRLQRLAVFEAAARLGSFTAAAGELGMTQPAVTRQIRALEAELGVVLFDRSANRAPVSDAGRGLQKSVDQGFTTIELELERIGAGKSVFVLAANPGVAQRWLVPYLDSLRSAIGGVDLRLWLFDRNAELDGGVFDAAIHAGNGCWPGLECKLLFPEIVLPVATPALATRLGLSDKTPPELLLDETLLHLDQHDRTWMSWTSWFAHHGFEVSSHSAAVVYNNYALVLQEAIAGHGIALAWRYLIDSLLDQGLLTAVGPEVCRAGSGYYLIWPGSNQDDKVLRLATWLGEFIEPQERIWNGL